MNQQWLTILMSKGIELDQKLRQQIQTAKAGIKSQLEERGIKLNPVDLAALLEEYSPQASNAALSYALDILRPFSSGMGLRVSKLADTHIEVIVPNRTRNMNEYKVLHEGALQTAAIESAKILWMRHAPMGIFIAELEKMEAEHLGTSEEEVRMRLEITDEQRESVLEQIRETRESKTECEVTCFDNYDQVLAKFKMTLKFKHTPSLESSEEQ